jgi:hypothetical protein
VADKTPGVTETPELEQYVNELEAELDAEIAGLDSNYSPKNNNESDTDDDLDNNYTPINRDEATDTDADATREQASADDDMQSHHNDENDDKGDKESQDEDDERPLPRLRRKRTPSYGHLKGMDRYRPSPDQTSSVAAITNCM